MSDIKKIANDFELAFQKLREIPYNPNWANGTGYFNGCVTDHTVREAARSTAPDGRRIIIVPIRAGDMNIVFFERYTNTKEHIIVHHPTYNLGRKSNRAMFIPTSHHAADPRCSLFLDLLIGIKHREEQVAA